jgi:hypothetical protein
MGGPAPSAKGRRGKRKERGEKPGRLRPNKPQTQAGLFPELQPEPACVPSTQADPPISSQARGGSEPAHYPFKPSKPAAFVFLFPFSVLTLHAGPTCKSLVLG